MKLVMSWLQEWVPLSIDMSTLCEKLTMAGLEVEGTELIENDTVIEVDLTPNRGDCLSVMGLAREIALICDQPFKIPDHSTTPVTSTTTFPVTIEAAQACGQYVGRVIEGIDISQPTPAWIQSRLTRAGLRSIDAVVDVTNYVMLELGQPLHAFDFNTLQTGIRVRMAAPEETLTLLDDKTITLTETCLVIADAEKPLALAGIMGGRASAVSNKTTSIFLESAFFVPEAIAGRARLFALHTDSSHRFERGVDPALQERALERASQLLLSIVGGQAGPIIHSAIPATLPAPRKIMLRSKRLQQILGMDLAPNVVASVFPPLGMTVETIEQGWMVCVPTARFDIHQEIDLIEEVARVVGYDNIPTTTPVIPMRMQPHSEMQISVRDCMSVFIQRGLIETINYAFLAPSLQQAFQFPYQPMTLLNPISQDLSEMRMSLLPGLVQTYRHNAARQQSRIRLCETGLCFWRTPEGELLQTPMIAALISGSAAPIDWGTAAKTVDFYDMKSLADSLLALTHQHTTVRYVPSQLPALHPTQQAEIYLGDQVIGYVGALHPGLAKSLDVDDNVFLLECRLAPVLLNTITTFVEPSKYPSIKRDLAFLVNREIPSSAILAKINEIGGDILQDAYIFDVYQGKGIDPSQKSIAISLLFYHHNRTLVEEEVTGLVQKIGLSLKYEFSVTLRE